MVTDISVTQLCRLTLSRSSLACSLLSTTRHHTSSDDQHPDAQATMLLAVQHSADQEQAAVLFGQLSVAWPVSCLPLQPPGD